MQFQIFARYALSVSTFIFASVASLTLSAHGADSKASADFVTITYLGGLWRGMNDVHVAGQLAFCASDNGLTVVDVSDPTQPVVVSQLFVGGRPRFIDVNGTLAALGHEASLWSIVDITAPHDPQLLAVMQAPDLVYGIGIVPPYVYVGANNAGLLVYDVSVPSFPVLVDSLDLPFAEWELEIQEDRLYITGDQLKILDISVPQSPVLLGMTDSLLDTYRVAVNGDYAYVGDVQFSPPLTSYIRAINISNPASPVVTGEIEFVDAVLSISSVGGNAFVASGFGPGRKLDLSNPAEPALAGTYNTLSAIGTYIEDSLAYVVSPHSGMWVLNVNAAGDPDSVGRLGSFSTTTAISYAGSHAYVSLYFDNTTPPDTPISLIVSIEEPATPVIVDSVFAELGHAEILDSTAYVMTGGGVDVYDISTPESPLLINSVNVFGSPVSIRFMDTLMIVAHDNSAQTSVYSITNPHVPTFVSNVDQDSVSAIATKDTLLFLTTRIPFSNWDHLVAYSLSDPLNPAMIVQVDSVKRTIKLATTDEYLIQLEETPIAAPKEFELVLYSLADSSFLLRLGSITMAGESSDLESYKGRALVAKLDFNQPEATSGVSVVDLTNPMMPEIATGLPAYLPVDVAIGDSLLLVATTQSGLLIAALESPADPVLGDVNTDFVITSADIIYMVNYVFRGGAEPLPTAANGDVNCDAVVNSADIIFEVNHIFKGGPAPSCP